MQLGKRSGRPSGRKPGCFRRWNLSVAKQGVIALTAKLRTCVEAVKLPV
jgi:hypothetical protein